MVDRDLLAQALEREAGRVFDYCRALVGRDDVAMSVTEAALNSARSMLQEPDRLRAWLLDLARRQARPADVGDAASPRATPFAEPAADPEPDQGILQPDSREVFELVYRHGIHREDLGAVLGVPAEEASALLAAAERELGRPEPPTTPDQAVAAPRPADPIPGQSMLPAPDRLRAWLFALARQEALAVVASRAASQPAPGTALVRYTHDFAATDPERKFPPASWWQDSVAQPTPRRRLRIAALTAIPLAAAIGLAVYLGGVSQPVGSSAAASAGSPAPGGAGIPPLVLPNASLAAAAPRPSPSPTVPIWALFPASPSPVVPPPPPPPPAPSPTPSPTVKPSPTPTPKPSASATPKPSASATPKPSASATPKPSASKSTSG